jgi:hypothetical protein
VQVESGAALTGHQHQLIAQTQCLSITGAEHSMLVGCFDKIQVSAPQ